MTSKVVRYNKYAVMVEVWDDNRLISYEVFHKRFAPKKTINGQVIPEHMMFPNDEAFGVWAWSFSPHLEVEALIKFGELTGKRKTKDVRH
jgi:hypothetical protein